MRPPAPLRTLAARLSALGLALLLGLAGGTAARAAGLPLPYMLGSLVTLAVVAMLGLRPFGITPWLPESLRQAFVPVIGVAIGAAFTPELLDHAGAWIPSLAALLLYVPLAHWLGYRIYRGLGGLSPATAYFAAMPGGLIEALTMGEERGADRRMLTLLQFLRLILCVVLVPLGFLAATGTVVGSAAGVRIEGAELPLRAADIALLVAAGAGGFALGRLLRVPGGIIVMPMLLSAAIHLAGLTRTVPPGWAVALTQLVIGTSLGLRFLGMDRRTLLRAFGLALANIAAMLTLAAAAALALAGAVGEAPQTLLIAFAPGGVAEMSLVAISLHLSVAFVSAHHLLRILLAVAVAQLGARLLLGPRGG